MPANHTNMADEALVARSLSGDRDAFARIVERYQTLVCSVAYAATGHLNVSEEVAQETFVVAWQSLDSLNDPEKLRAWLCGIVRNRARERGRKQRRDLLSQAIDVHRQACPDASAPDPALAMVAREEEDLLDRTLATLPDNYREPLVLFYRERQSVARVAELLDLTPNTVKQRLARGRAMLRAEVTAVVERGLMRSAPGRAFTVGVLTALPIMTSSAKAATITLTTTKGASAMGAATWMAWTGVVLGPLTGILGSWFGYSMSMKHAQSEGERSVIRRMTIWIIVWIAIAGAALTALLAWAQGKTALRPTALAIGIASVGFIYAGGLFASILWWNRKLAQVRADTPPSPEMVSPASDVRRRPRQVSRSFESRWRFLSLPLLAVQFRGELSHPTQPAVGWIAIGDRAFGVLFAVGSVAVGGIAFGAISVGLLSVGGLAVGALALGGLTIGYASSGGLALGVYAFAGIAIAWKAAIGGVAISANIGMGGLCVAPHMNDDVSREFLQSSEFFRFARHLMSPWGWWILLGIGLAPLFVAMRLVPSADASASDTSE